MSEILHRATIGKYSASEFISGRIIVSLDTEYFDSDRVTSACGITIHLTKNEFRELLDTLKGLESQMKGDC